MKFSLSDFWDNYSYLLVLPAILLVGVLIIAIISGISLAFQFVVHNVPFSVLGIVLGSFLVFIALFFLLDNFRENGIGWQLAGEGIEFQLILALVGIAVLICAAAYIFIPQKIKTGWEIVQTIGAGIIGLAVLYACLFVCGEFLAQGILLIKRKIYGGFFLILVAIINLIPFGYLSFEGIKDGYLVQNWLKSGLSLTLTLIVLFFLVKYFVIAALKQK